MELRRVLDDPGGVGRDEAARRLSVNRSTIDGWLNGHYSPKGKNRSAIEEQFPAVASRWWDQPAVVEPAVEHPEREAVAS